MAIDRSGKIAIIDDAADSLEMLQFALENDGCKVVSFSNGLDFLKTLSSAEYRLVLLDIAMPEINGYETFDAIRKLDRNVPVIAVTGHAFDAAKHRILDHGFTDVLIKPLNLAHVMELINRHTRPSK